MNSNGCILNCKDDTISPSYLSSDNIHCIASCKNNDNGKAINYLGEKCVATCATTAYLDISGADN